RDDARGRSIVAVHSASGQRAELEERTARVEQRLDAVARQKLAASDVLRARILAAARGRRGLARPELLDEPGHVSGIRAKLGAASVDARGDARHGAVALTSSRPISMRRISLVPAPIS